MENERKKKKSERERARYHEKKKELNKKCLISLKNKSTTVEKNFLPCETDNSRVTRTKRSLKRKSSLQNLDTLIRDCKKRKKTTGKTGKTVEEKRAYEREKKRKQREKIYADPSLHLKFLESQKIYDQKKKRESIATMNSKEQKKQRQKWRIIKRRQRKVKKNVNLTNDTENNESPILSKTPNKISGVRRARKNRYLNQLETKSLVEKIQKLEKEKFALKRRSETLKKRLQRSKTPQDEERSPTPSKKVARTMRLGTEEIKRQLNFSFALQKQIKVNYISASSAEKTAISRTLAGNIVKKYQGLKFLTGLVSLKRFRAHIDKPGIILKKQSRNELKKVFVSNKILEFLSDDEISTQSPDK